ncbi:unnamed protein product [Malus baccata var. baccata]
MGAIILYFQSGLEIGSAYRKPNWAAGIDRRPGHGKGLRSTLSGDEVALPVAAEEAFTGVLDSGKGQMNAVAEGLKEFSRDDLLKLMAKGGVL